jgi:hypothetical protein
MNTKKQIRNNFRTLVFTRDKYRCKICGKTGYEPKECLVR